MRVLQIANRWLGDGQPCFIAAEIGINHNGDLALAHRTIDAAADCGVDAVKFQNYRTEDFVSDRSSIYQYRSQGKTVSESQYEMFKRNELSSADLLELKQHCDQREMIFFSTPTSQDGVELLVNMGAPLLKNGSDFLGHLPLIKAMARTGLPTVLSTGMATFDEIAASVNAFREAGGENLILLHCTSAYPTPPHDVHLRKIPALAHSFQCLVGFSDHSLGNLAAIGAVTMGACFLEKHFTLDKNLPGPDHSFSADPAELSALVSEVRNLEKCLGSGDLKPATAEAAGRRDFRLSCVSTRELPPGHRLTAADIAFRRPGAGYPPDYYNALLDRAITRQIRAGHVFSPEDFL